MKKIILNGEILYEGKFIKNYGIIFNEKIEKIVSLEDIDCINIENNYIVIDAKGNYVLPGFIDQHIHGFQGVDTMDATEEAFRLMKSALVKNGVTSFLPTTVTYSEDVLNKVCEVARNFLNNNIGGAKVQGVHLEGPFINEKRKGAQNEKYIGAVTERFMEKNKDVLKIVTVAPEVEGVKALVSKYKELVNFQIGHSNANYNEAVESFKSGIKGTTHLFNAMSPLHHRDLGVVGATFTEDCYAEIICDNIHVTKEAYEIVVKNIGIDKTILITDSMSAGGLEEGEYILGGLKVILKDNACRLLDGTLAGSTLTLNKALKNMYENTNCTLEECVKMVTKNQAEYLKLSNEVGELKVGLYSDIVLMDKKFDIKKTFVNGECVYEV